MTAGLVLAGSLLPNASAYGAVSTEPDVPRLPAGSLPKLPYVNWGARTIVDGSRRVSISGIQHRVVELHKVDGGYLLRRNLDSGKDDLVFVSTGGTRKVIEKLLWMHGTIKVSKDGSKVLLNRRLASDFRTYADTAVLALPSGRVLQTRKFGFYAPGLFLYGTDRTLITGHDETDGNRSDAIWWTPATGHTEVVRGSTTLESADLSAWQWAVRPKDGINSYGVGPIPPKAGPEWLFPQEDWNIGSWSPNSALIWGNNEVTDQLEGYGSTIYFVFRASDGAIVLRVRNVVDPRASWESDDALLLSSAYGTGSDRRYQLLRCRLSGACSRVGPASTSPAGAIIPATRRG
jgi:hypothetical protein